MKGYKSETIRNVALLGHGGCGKTTFLEEALFQTGVIKKPGKVEDGNTVSDYDKMEIEKGYSINTSIVPVEWKDKKINFIDTPGYFDFVGEVNAALTVAEAAVIMVDAGSGVEVGTEQAWKSCEKHEMPRFIIISRKVKDEFDFDKTLAELKEAFGSKLVPLTWPMEEDLDDDLIEAIAESSDELLEKYFEGEEFTKDEILEGMVQGISKGNIVPVCTPAFEQGEKLDEFLDILVDLVPDPVSEKTYKTFDEKGEEIELKADKDAPVSALVFKTISDEFVGKISVMKVMTGKLQSGQEIYNSRAEERERLGKLFFLRGKNQEETDVALTGDIVATAKLQYTESGDTLCDRDNIVSYEPPEVPSPTYYLAIEAQEKKDEEKMGIGLRKLREEDPSFVLEHNTETRQTLLGGQGDIHLSIILAKLKDRFGVSVKTVPQKIAYRETIRGNSDAEGKHKKQTGGAGQYGHVWIRFSPSDKEFEFEEDLFGGSVPKNYVPAVEKGLLECMESGPLAGCKCTGIKAVLHDGSYHEVDSNEVSFKMAAALAFRKGIKEANPCLLEPVMHLEITVPDAYMGDVMGDMNKRRGKILGMEPQKDGGQTLVAEAPQAELFDYALGLRAMTQGRGQFVMNFDRYQEVPKALADKIIEEHAKEEN